jgi:hypothetical protein
MTSNPRMSPLAAVSPFLLRETTSNVLLIVEFFRITGTSYMQTVLQDVVVAVEAYAKINQAIGSSQETGPNQQSAADKTERLMALSTQLVSGILKTSPSKLPATLRYVAKCLHSALILQISDAGHPVAPDESLALLQLIVSHLLGVRFFCLGLTCPALFLLPEPRSEFSQDSLITLSNVLLSLMGVSLNKIDTGGTSPLHIHVSEMSSDCESFFANVHKNKSLRDNVDTLRSQLMKWLGEVATYNELDNKPTGPLAFFALETYGIPLGNWICENALDFIVTLPHAVDHRSFYEFLALNKSLIAHMDNDRRLYKPQMLLGPGIWNAMQYGKAWNFEIKLPSRKTQDIFVGIPSSVSLTNPISDRSILDWVLKYSSDMDFLILIFIQPSAKLSASTVRLPLVFRLSCSSYQY